MCVSLSFNTFFISVGVLFFFFFFCKIVHRPKLKNKDPGPDALCFKGLGLVHRS